MAVVRKCEHCGRIDARVSWPSEKDAGKDPVLATWTCPMCAWTEFDLVEARGGAGGQPLTSGAGAGLRAVAPSTASSAPRP